MANPALKTVLQTVPRSGKFALGGFVFSPDPDISAVYAHAGFDFVIVDMEHGANDIRSVLAHVRACQAYGIAPVVRLGVANFADAGRLLDAGVGGLMLPHYGMPGYGANEVTRAMKYAPQGNRPTCTGVAAAGFGLAPFGEVVKQSNAEVLSMGLIEDVIAVDDIDNILEQVSVDCLMPGPADLAASMGVHGQLTHPRVVAAVQRIREAAARHEIPLGLYINSPQDILPEDQGKVAFYVYSIDYKAFARHLKDVEVAARQVYSRVSG